MYPACPVAYYAGILPGPLQWTRRQRKPQITGQILTRLEWKPTACVPKSDPHDHHLSSSTTTDSLGTQITDRIPSARTRSRYMPSSECHNSTMHAHQILLFQNLQRVLGVGGFLFHRRLKCVFRLWILQALNALSMHLKATTYSVARLAGVLAASITRSQLKHTGQGPNKRVINAAIHDMSSCRNSQHASVNPTC